MWLRSLAILALVLMSPMAAFGQATVLQGGPWAPGHAPMYVGQSSGQPVLQDSGPARGGTSGVGLGESAIVARGYGLPPYVGQGSGPYGTISCVNDGPIDSSAGYHYLCLSANAQGGGLIVYGAGGGASPLPLQFIINGVTITGATCSGSPTSSFVSIDGIVTHC